MKEFIKDFYSYKRIHWCHVNSLSPLNYDYAMEIEWVSGIRLKE